MNDETDEPIDENGEGSDGGRDTLIDVLSGDEIPASPKKALVQKVLLPPGRRTPLARWSTCRGDKRLAREGGSAPRLRAVSVGRNARQDADGALVPQRAQSPYARIRRRYLQRASVREEVRLRFRTRRAFSVEAVCCTRISLMSIY